MKRLTFFLAVLFLISASVSVMASEGVEEKQSTKESADIKASDTDKGMTAGEERRRLQRAASPPHHFRNTNCCFGCVVGSMVIIDNSSYGLFGNYAIPGGGIDDSYDGSHLGGFKIRPWTDIKHKNVIQMESGIELTFSKVEFEDENSSDDFFIKCLNINYNFSSRKRKKIAPFIFIGPGYYSPEVGKDEYGINAGAEVLAVLTGNLMLDISAVYHTIFDSGDDTSFTEFRVGLNYNP